MSKKVQNYISKTASVLKEENDKSIVSNPVTQRSVHIIQQFLKEKKRVLYGGKAVNDSLPRAAQFYDRKTTRPDYDFYTPNAKEDAILLADRLHRANVPYVEVKTSSIHESTYKVFADFIPIADATELDPKTYRMVQKEAILGPDKILLASPDWLRMNMYLELARPKGDVERWEKVSERLQLLNKHRPLKLPTSSCPRGQSKAITAVVQIEDCGDIKKASQLAAKFIHKHKLVMVGGSSLNVYLNDIYKIDEKKIDLTSDYDVLVNDASKMAEEFRKELIRNNLENVFSVQFRRGIPELIGDRYRVFMKCGKIEKSIIDFYQNDNCWSYQTVTLPFHNNSKKNIIVRIGSIETLVTFLFKWLFFLKDKLGKYVMRGKVYCMIEFLLYYRNQMRKPLFVPVPVNCYGNPVTLYSIRKDKWNEPGKSRPFNYRPQKKKIA